TRLRVAGGCGGGSADAAAALRHLARHNRLALDDPRLAAAARATGADVPVCLDPRPRLMRGVGEILSAPIGLSRLPAVLVNPRMAVPTKDVFARLAAPRILRLLPNEPHDFPPVDPAPFISDLRPPANGLPAPPISPPPP